MPKPNAYIETTIPNFYYDMRPDPEMIARRAWTREWWETAHTRYELISSDAVVEELEAGTSARVPLRLALLTGLRVLEISPSVLETVRVYMHHKLMPANPSGDALHLALASHYECDFIVTWNCKHLANANKFAHIRKINTMLGLAVPEIVTPQELLRRNR
ncbi:MAG TPA: type II toxin-antitoxin system VapC family toxin [Longimicrobium sp.]|nr:type II toxin-antitoxin system VapC family toxin [Longimicrobium sp.]